MFSPNTVTAIGWIALAVCVFAMLATIRGMRIWMKDRREAREYAAGEPAREEKAHRIAARAVANVTRDAKTSPPRAKAKPVTAPVTVPRTSARAAASKKWDPFSDVL